MEDSYFLVKHFPDFLLCTGCTELLPLIKVIYPKYSKHWPYTVAHTIACVCSKMLIHGLFLSLFMLIQNLEFLVWNSSCEMIIQAVGINLVRFKKWQKKRQAKSVQMWNQKEWIISLFFSSKGQLISKQNCRAIAFPKKQTKPTQNSILSAFGSFFGKSYSLAIFFRDLLPFRDFALMIFDTWN